MKATISLVITAGLLGMGWMGCRGTSARPPLTPAAPWVRICVLQDISGSIKTTRTPVLTPDHIQALAETVASTGGEIGFGLIQESSDLPLLRGSWEPPEPEPEKPGNALLRGRWRKKHEEWKQKMEERHKRVLEFRKEAEERLRRKPAPATDVCGALRRCFLMAAEPVGKQTRTIILVVSDGLHNVRRSSRCPEPVENIEMLAVNGQGIFGVLKAYKPRLFESPDAALRYIREALGGHRP
jgi:hypothetical protein